jgi:hypothetical protein
MILMSAPEVLDDLRPGYIQCVEISDQIMKGRHPAAILIRESQHDRRL